ncbi:MAG: radical SAM protein [bacterium]
MKISLIQVGPNSKKYPFRSHPLGLMLLSAYVERELPGTEVNIWDMKVSGNGIGSAVEAAVENNAEVVGLSAMSPHRLMLHRASALIRQALPETFVVVGGPHATCSPAEVLEDENVDAAVFGDGERALVNILSALRDGRSIDGIPAAGTRAHLAPDERAPFENLDDLPFPAWNKVDFADYERYSGFSVLGRRRYMSVLTSRACPYQCIYCHNVFGKRFRSRSAENVLEELRTLVSDFGIRDFEIIDDVFNLDRNRAVAICEGILKEDLKVKLVFPNGLRSDLLDDELIELMKEAGTVFIAFAIETATPRLQKLIRKNLDLDRARRAMKTASKLGIFTNGFFMVGFPTETERELRATVDFALSSPLQITHFLKVTPFEGTQLHSMLSDEARDFVKRNPDESYYSKFNFNLSEVPARRFISIVRTAYLRFFFNPFRVISILRRHPYRLNLFWFAGTVFRRVFLRD